MSDMTLKDLAEKMRKLDHGMLTTRTEGGALASRPMSNNGEVEYDGDSYFFTDAGTTMVSDIQADPNVGLTFTGSAGFFGTHSLYIAMEGQAELVRDKAQFKAHWHKALDAWFKDGIDTPGLVMIKVHAERIHYWNGMDDGEVVL
jgi:general stress protein 26